MANPNSVYGYTYSGATGKWTNDVTGKVVGSKPAPSIEPSLKKTSATTPKTTVNTAKQSVSTPSKTSTPSATSQTKAPTMQEFQQQLSGQYSSQPWATAPTYQTTPASNVGGVSYINPQQISQLIPGASVSYEGGQSIIRLPDGRTVSYNPTQGGTNQVNISGKPTVLDKPITYQPGGHTQLPTRALLEALGYNVGFNQNTGQVTAQQLRQGEPSDTDQQALWQLNQAFQPQYQTLQDLIGQVPGIYSQAQETYLGQLPSIQEKYNAALEKINAEEERQQAQMNQILENRLGQIKANAGMKGTSGSSIENSELASIENLYGQNLIDLLNAVNAQRSQAAAEAASNEAQIRAQAASIPVQQFQQLSALSQLLSQIPTQQYQAGQALQQTQQERQAEAFQQLLALLGLQLNQQQLQQGWQEALLPYQYVMPYQNLQLAQSADELQQRAQQNAMSNALDQARINLGQRELDWSMNPENPLNIQRLADTNTGYTPGSQEAINAQIAQFGSAQAYAKAIQDKLNNNQQLYDAVTAAAFQKMFPSLFKKEEAPLQGIFGGGSSYVDSGSSLAESISNRLGSK